MAPLYRRKRALAGALSALVLASILAIEARPVGALSPVTVTRISGSDRFTTARLTAEAMFPEGTTFALLARADAFPDALAGSYLAGHLGAPILLTGSASLHPQALLGLDTLGVTNVTLLGSPAAISEAVRASLEAEGFVVTRIGGANRFETAAEIARFPTAGGIDTLLGRKTAVIASGLNFPDALAAGPITYRPHFPLLLTAPDALSPATASALDDLGIAHVLLIGGPGAVSDGVEAAIQARGITVDRIFGPTRYDTAAEVATFARDALGFATDELILATGSNFPDAVAAGPLGGREGAPILLTADPLPEPTTFACGENQPTVDELFVMGSPDVVSDAAVDLCRQNVEAGPGLG